MAKPKKHLKKFVCLEDNKGFDTSAEFSDHIHSVECTNPVPWQPSADWMAMHPDFVVGFPRE